MIGSEFLCFCLNWVSVTLLFWVWGVGPEYTVFSGMLLMHRIFLRIREEEEGFVILKRDLNDAIVKEGTGRCDLRNCDELSKGGE